MLPLNHHAEMLADFVRLRLYKQAINKVVQKKDVVVDLGCGFGVLGAYAKTVTRAKVFGVEYFSDVASIAKDMYSDDDCWCIINDSSYDVILPVNPDVVITETIGLNGVDENIVEILFDFKFRHPGVREIIPSKLNLFIQPIFSEKLRSSFEDLMDKLMSSSSNDFQLNRMEERFKAEYCSQIHRDLLLDAEKIGHPYPLVEYKLGKAKSSDFSKIIEIDSPKKWNGLNIYFEAELTEGLILSNGVGCKATHWAHGVILRPEEACKISLEYHGDREFKILWS